MKKLIPFLLIFAFNFAHAMNKGGSSIGLQTGNVSQGADVGLSYGSALGWGVYYQYATSDNMAFELAYMYSKHSGSANNANLNMVQHGIWADLIYNFNYWVEFIPYVKGGADFVMHAPNDIAGVGSNTSYQNLNSFGFNLGLGAEYMLNEATAVGLDLAFHNMFDVTVMAPGNPNAKAIQNYTTFLLRLVYKFDSPDSGKSSSDEE